MDARARARIPTRGHRCVGPICIWTRARGDASSIISLGIALPSNERDPANSPENRQTRESVRRASECSPEIRVFARTDSSNSSCSLLLFVQSVSERPTEERRKGVARDAQLLRVTNCGRAIGLSDQRLSGRDRSPSSARSRNRCERRRPFGLVNPFPSARTRRGYLATGSISFSSPLHRGGSPLKRRRNECQEACARARAEIASRFGSAGDNDGRRSHPRESNPVGS